MDDDEDLCSPWWPERSEPAWPEVTETDNPVTAMFEAVDGSPLIVLTERPTLPFGFRSAKETP